MPSQKNPEVKVWVNLSTSYSDVFGTYTEVTNDVKRFTIRDGGALRIATCDIILRNPNGDYTNPNSATYINLYSAVKIEVSVRTDAVGNPIWDEIFRGWFYRDQSEVIGMRPMELRMRCLGLAVKLREETISYRYREENDLDYPNSKWFIDKVIDDFFRNPDSG